MPKSEGRGTSGKVFLWGSGHTDYLQRNKPGFGFRFGPAEATFIRSRRLNQPEVSSYPHLIYSPSFLSISSKTCSEISATHFRSTVVAHKTALKKRIIPYPRHCQVHRNTVKFSDESRLNWPKHPETGSKRKLTQLYPSADVSNLHAWRIRSVALSTNKVIWTSG
jgi:hypothetical protein